MNRFGPYPFVRILLPFLLGILAEIHLNLPDRLTGILLAVLFAIYSVDFFTKNYCGKFSWRYYNGIFLMIILFLSGSFWTGFFDDRKKDDHYTHLESGQKFFLAEISNDPVTREKSVKAEVRLLEVCDGKQKRKVSGKVILYLKRDMAAQNLQYGQRIYVNAALQPVPPPQNPGEFNYQRYCSYRRIYAQAYADEFHWRKADEGRNSVTRWALDLRKDLLQTLRDAGLKDQELAVASALILGYTHEIDGPTKSAYASSGALHVLSVSGLHVAIIYVVFDYLFFFLLYFKRGKYYKAFLILTLLWLYALLTGLSPSVIRSATMLSSIVIGKLINRNASVYNSICASAFLILCFDPLIIMDVGFQLSYLAVMGIVYLHPKIYHLFFFRNRIIDFVWNISAVSVAAQLITFPLGLFYFHQFPNYFLLSNLAVIPLGTIILYVGVAALVFYAVPYVSDGLFFLLKWSVKLLNESVYLVEQLPYAITPGISITLLELILIYTIVFSFFIFTETKKPGWLKFALTCISVLFTGFTIGKYRQQEQSAMIVYNIRGNVAIDFVTGRRSVLVSSEELQQQEGKIQFHIDNHHAERGILESEFIPLNENCTDDPICFFKKKAYFAFHDQTGILIDAGFIPFHPVQKLKLDYVILSENASVSIAEIKRMFSFQKIIIDNSNSFYRIRQWKEELREEDAVYYVMESGAFIREG